jgi:hypothetical protein
LPLSTNGVAGLASVATGALAAGAGAAVEAGAAAVEVAGAGAALAGAAGAVLALGAGDCGALALSLLWLQAATARTAVNRNGKRFNMENLMEQLQGM